MRKADGALIGRCGLTDMVVESAQPEHGMRRAWFGRERAPADIALTYETELGYTLDSAAWGHGFASKRKSPAITVWWSRASWFRSVVLVVGQVRRRARATGAAGRPVVVDPSRVVVVTRVLR